MVDIGKKMIKIKNPREAAYLSVLTALREETYVSDFLEKWRAERSPSNLDFNLAQEIAYGSMRMALALDYVAEQLAEKKKLSLKLREKVLLRTAIYQFYYMTRVPPYAITNETVEIAKKYCHEVFLKFLNAILRKLSETQPPLPVEKTVPEMSVRYSYPPFYVQELIQNHGLQKAEKIMDAGNKPAPVMFRIRPKAKEKLHRGPEVEMLTGTHVPIGVIKDTSILPKIVKSPDYYIQNVTPAELIHKLCHDIPNPKRILDLCSSPGGKLIAVHDHFTRAELVANDISPGKLKPLSENITKYGVTATLSCEHGEEYTSPEPFDIVILDVPCTNSGVLNKRPEARWRISNKTIEQIEQLQMKLLKQAITLLSSNGEIWYMTCSVLKRENELLTREACEVSNLEIRVEESIFPNHDGWDGGYACALKQKEL